MGRFRQSLSRAIQFMNPEDPVIYISYYLLSATDVLEEVARFVAGLHNSPFLGCSPSFGQCVHHYTPIPFVELIVMLTFARHPNPIFLPADPTLVQPPIRGNPPVFKPRRKPNKNAPVDDSKPSGQVDGRSAGKNA
jgi:hypothetical protein